MVLAELVSSVPHNAYTQTILYGLNHNKHFNCSQPAPGRSKLVSFNGFDGDAIFAFIFPFTFKFGGNFERISVMLLVWTMKRREKTI